MSDTLKNQYESSGLLGAMTDAYDPYIRDWKNDPTHKFIRGETGFTPEVAERFGGGILGTFGGIKAKTADMAALSAAKTAELNGMSRSDIIKNYGWFRGHNGDWMFEIPDTGMKIDRVKLSKLAPNETTTLGNVMTHDKFFAAYPEFKNMRVEQGINGAYNPETTMLSFPATYTDSVLKDVSAHELNHAVSHFEGRPTGGLGRYKANENLRRLYMRNADEIESRMVGARTYLTDEQLKKYPPRFTVNPDVVIDYTKYPFLINNYK